ncbi:hypothetical protein Tco_0359453 [Tanacetum coccineum]
MYTWRIFAVMRGERERVMTEWSYTMVSIYIGGIEMESESDSYEHVRGVVIRIQKEYKLRRHLLGEGLVGGGWVELDCLRVRVRYGYAYVVISTLPRYSMVVLGCVDSVEAVTLQLTRQVSGEVLGTSVFENNRRRVAGESSESHRAHIGDMHKWCVSMIYHNNVVASAQGKQWAGVEGTHEKCVMWDTTHI